MELKTSPSLPADRAFLVQLADDVDIEAARVSGRVEHVRSGEATHFDSVPELVTFMRQLVGG